MALTEDFEVLANTDLWEQAAVVLVAFLLGTVARNLIEPNSPYDLPDEVYGLVVAFAAGYSPMYRTEMRIGGMVYTADKLAERAGLKSTVQGVGN